MKRSLGVLITTVLMFTGFVATKTEPTDSETITVSGVIAVIPTETTLLEAQIDENSNDGAGLNVIKEPDTLEGSAVILTESGETLHLATGDDHGYVSGQTAVAEVVIPEHIEQLVNAEMEPEQITELVLEKSREMELDLDFSLLEVKNPTILKNSVTNLQAHHKLDVMLVSNTKNPRNFISQTKVEALVSRLSDFGTPKQQVK